MDAKFDRLSKYIKKAFGLCEHKGCFHKNGIEIKIPLINSKRNLCNEHICILTERFNPVIKIEVEVTRWMK